VVQEGGRRCKKSTLNDLVHLTPLRIPLMNPPDVNGFSATSERVKTMKRYIKKNKTVPLLDGEMPTKMSEKNSFDSNQDTSDFSSFL
jgi:hypothetical protein